MFLLYFLWNNKRTRSFLKKLPRNVCISIEVLRTARVREVFTSRRPSGVCSFLYVEASRWSESRVSWRGQLDGSVTKGDAFREPGQVKHLFSMF